MEDIKLDFCKIRQKINKFSKTKQLTQIFNELYDLTLSVASQLDKNKNMEENMSRLKIKKESYNSDTSYIKAVSNQPTMNIKPLINIPVKKSNLKLSAIIVRRASEVKSNGLIHYISSEDKFSIKVNGHIIKGNIGNILKKGDDLVKIKDCRNGAECTNERCTYLHPIETRNYLEQNFMYKPSTLPFNDSFTKFGSADNIDVDFSNLNETTKKRLIDMYVHNMICCFTLLEN